MRYTASQCKTKRNQNIMDSWLFWNFYSYPKRELRYQDLDVKIPRV